MFEPIFAVVWREHVFSAVEPIVRHRLQAVSDTKEIERERKKVITTSNKMKKEQGR